MLLCMSFVLQASIGLADTGSADDSGSVPSADTASTAVDTAVSIDSGGLGDTASASDTSTDTASASDTSTDTAMMLPGDDTADGGCAGSSTIKINELLVNPSGTDSGREWVELYNAGSTAVDLSSWSIEWGTSSFSSSASLDGSALEPGEYLLIGGSEVAAAHVVASLNLGNAGSSADGVRLVDCMGQPADTVIYGSSNPDEWLDDTGAVSVSWAERPGDDESMARGSDGLDTDQCGVDFLVEESPTPGAANAEDISGDSGTVEPGSCETAGLKINELMANPDGSDDGSEWLELYNPTAEAVSLDGWELESGTSSYSSTSLIGEGVWVPAGGFVVLGGSSATEVDTVIDLYLGNASSGADAVRLLDCDGAVIDTVLYGSANPEDWADDDGLVAVSIGSNPSEGSSLGRTEDGLDTNQCGDDFAVLSPSPGVSNSGGGEPGGCETGSLSIKINEVLPDPDGADAGLEFVELYNAGDDRVDLSGWGLDAATSSWGSSPDFVLPEGTKIGAGRYLLIASFAGADVNDGGQISLGNAGTGPDGLRLLDCVGAVQDTLLYAGAGDVAVDLLLDDAGDQGMAVMPGGDLSLGRVPNGADSDDCSVDFQTDMTPTPGAANSAGSTPADCVPGSLTVVVNEFLPNPESTDTNREFIELYNAGSETVQLGGWGIKAGTQDFDEDADFSFPGGASIAPGGFAVVAGIEIPEADFYLGDGNSFDLGNASTAPDGVQLVDCLGDAQDTVLYGGSGDPAMDLGLSDDLGAQTMATMPGENLTVGRYPDGVDSDTNDEDFFTNMPPSPGAANIRGGGGGGEEDTGGCGCGSSKDPGGGEPAPSATYAPLGAVLGLLSLVAMRRRED
jgi:hypothetical protein